MTLRRALRHALVSVLALSLVYSPVHALVSLNDGHDHIYVTGSVTMGWTSNLFANSDAKSDYSVGSSLVVEYQRRAGWIGVNASVGIDATSYNVFTEENFANPKFSAEFTKQTGRTTGSLTLSAARQSRADAAINTRTTSWNYGAGLNARYPIVSIYTLTGSLSYSQAKYLDSVFPDLATYAASIDLIRLLSSERDLTVGYRYRLTEASVNSGYDDHSINAGLSGKLIRGLNGSLRAGYQTRVPFGTTVTGRPEPTHSSWTASGSATYALNKRANFTGTISKDFSTTATTASVDTTTASLDFQYAYSSSWSLTANASVGDSRFLGEGGRLVLDQGPPLLLGPQRHDTFLAYSASVNYSMNEHLKVSASYNWFQNWSNEPFADFIRSGYSLHLSSRW